MLHMLEYDYAPDPLEVAPGSLVMAMNFGPRDQSLPREQWGEFVHTVTAVDGSFDVQQIAPDGAPYNFTAPSAIGEYPYYCRYHGDAAGNGMIGTLRVTEDPPTPTATPSTATPPAATADAVPATDPAVDAGGSDAGDADAPASGALVALGGMALALALVATRARRGSR